jgi:DNA polymerase-3 subunit gamma/tau
LSYTALYRTWRPNKWEDVVNQKPVIKILQNALTENKVSHAYLFSGPRGTGKTTVARLLAKSVNCSNLQGSEPCNGCEACEAISAGSSVDVMEIDAASNRGIDEMRSLRESVRYLPVMGRFKVYIIDEVHMLTQEAFNALLKTLEEPPSHVIFILATTAAHKIPVTITSRCQRLEFRRLSIRDIEGRLEQILAFQDAQWEEGALTLIARAAEGSMRDALSVLDLCLAYGDGKVLEADVREILGAAACEIMDELFSAIAARDVKTILSITKDCSERGKDMGELCQEIGAYARDLLLVASGANTADLGRTRQEVANMSVLAQTLSEDMLIRVLKAMSGAVSEMRNSDNPRLVVDMNLLGLLLEDEAAGTGEMATGTIVSKMSAKAERQVQDTSQDTKPPREPFVSGDTADTSALSIGPETRESLSGTAGQSENVKHIWDSLLEQLQKDRKIQARAYLLPARPLRVDDDRLLVLGYPQGYATHMEQILSQPHKQVVQEYLEKLTKRKMNIRVEVLDNENGNGGNGGTGEELHPLVKAAITILDGKVT